MQTDKPLVSVAIPAYNMARYLPQAIESALGQLYPNIEVVVVDDGSTDTTPVVLNAYAGRITSIRQENAGVANALNTAIAASRGAYIRLLAADDAITPESTAIEVAHFQQHKGLGLVFAQGLRIDGEGNPLPGVIKPLAHSGDLILPSREAFGWLLKGSHIVCGTVMFSRGAFERTGGFRQKSVPGEDWDVFMRIAAFYDFAYIARPLSYYRIHEGSMTAGFSVEKLRASHAYTLGELYRWPEMPYPETRDRAYAYNDRTLALNAVYCRDPASFLRYFSSAIRRWPRIALERKSMEVLLSGSRMLVPISLLRPLRRLRSMLSARVQRRGTAFELGKDQGGRS